jgi:uncharacterized repeat protein (TIGR03803 family)
MTDKRSSLVRARFARVVLVRAGLGAVLVGLWFATCGLAIGQSEFLLYSFPSGKSVPPHGCSPQGSLAADVAGNLYGTASCGGAFNSGLVYELAKPVPPKKQWIQTVLYSFTGGSDGRSPMSGLTLDSAGNLYGTTYGGGVSGLGVVFELSPPATAGGPWTETVLHSFGGGPTDGATPGISGVVFDHVGNLYGVTRLGGNETFPECDPGCGIVYELTPPATPGAGWTENVIHYFGGVPASAPEGTPIFDGKGSLYGMTASGAVYRLVPPATEGGAWTYRLLDNIGFTTGGTAGSLTFHNGRLYGIGSAGQYSLGDVFELVPPAPGGTWTVNIIHSFAGGSDGISPDALGGVVFDKAGNLYGTTQYGGGHDCQPGFSGCGTVFELSPPAVVGGSWTETILHSFNAYVNDGEEPTGGVIFAKNGVLYGVTYSGGTDTQGAVYGVVP